MGTKKHKPARCTEKKTCFVFKTPRSKISLIKWDPPSCQAAAEILAQAKVAGVRVFVFLILQAAGFFSKDSTLNSLGSVFLGVAFA